MHTAKPKFSFLVPTFNRAGDLRRCLYSILATEYPNFEIVVNDNCSEDDTQAVVAAFTDPRISYKRQESNIGPELNILDAFERCTGDYVIVLTDDDLLIPHCIPTVLAIIREVGNVGMVLSPLSQISDSNGEAVPNHLDLGRDIVLQPGPQSLVDMFWHGHVLSRWVVRRDLIDLDGYKAQIGRHLYSPMWITSTALLKGVTVYVSRPLAVHKVFNKIYWSYPDDFMIAGVLDMIDLLLPGAANAPYREAMHKSVISRAVGQIDFVLSFGCDVLERYVLAVSRIPTLASREDFWTKFLQALTTNKKIPQDCLFRMINGLEVPDGSDADRLGQVAS